MVKWHSFEHGCIKFDCNLIVNRDGSGSYGGAIKDEEVMGPKLMGPYSRPRLRHVECMNGCLTFIFWG